MILKSMALPSPNSTLSSAKLKITDYDLSSSTQRSFGMKTGFNWPLLWRWQNLLGLPGLLWDVGI